MGTRPEAIKLCPLVKRLCEDVERFRVHVCATAQHREMLDGAMALFGVRPDSDLDLMLPGQGLNSLLARLIAAFDPILDSIRPDWVLVQGDTTTAMGCALAAFHRGIRVGHVEAGLRTGDLQAPFPEEFNRRVVALCADLHFAPTRRAADNLLREGVSPLNVTVTGNTVVDALNVFAQRPWTTPACLEGLDDGRSLVLVTAHRRESFGEPMECIVRAVARLAASHPDHTFVLPVHPNPAVRTAMEAGLGGVPGVHLVPPLDYLDLVQVLRRSRIVLTDSGGIQEEAPALGVPALVLRELTERPEGVESGNAILVGTDEEKIVSQAGRLLNDPEAHRAMAEIANPYGDGRACERIRDALLERMEQQ